VPLNLDGTGPTGAARPVPLITAPVLSTQREAREAHNLRIADPEVTLVCYELKNDTR
jgi:hypothetical protein